MENVDIFEKVRTEYYNLTASERKVADYILHDAEKVQFMSITELANACKVADSTVSRFCRSLEQSGFGGFKLELAKSIATLGEQKTEACDDTILGRSRKTGLLMQRAIEETIQLADEETVKRAVSLMEMLIRSCAWAPAVPLLPHGSLHTCFLPFAISVPWQTRPTCSIWHLRL